MHQGKDIEFFRTSPVAAAEYVAGQLIQLTGQKVISENEVRPHAGEFSEVSSGAGDYLIKSENISPEVRGFAIQTAVVNASEVMLDAEEESR